MNLSPKQVICHVRTSGAKNNPLVLQKRYLQAFWRAVGHRLGSGQCPKWYKLALMRELARIRVGPNRSAERRESFARLKHRLHNLHTHRKCFACREAPSTCRHHLIQLQKGGINSRKNLVGLCDDCHGMIHPWLRERKADAINAELDRAFDLAIAGG